MAQPVQDSSIYDAVEPLKDNGFDGLTQAVTVVYSTNTIESLNYNRLSQVIKGRGALPHDEAIKKLLYLGHTE